MDGMPFDLDRRMIGASLTRRTSLGLLLGLALAGVSDIDAETAKKRKKKKKKVCHNGDTKKVRNRKNHVTHGDSKGACPAVTPLCPEDQPIACDATGSWCCPDALPTCCSDVANTGFTCQPAGTACCGDKGSACTTTTEQCCPGSGDEHAHFTSPYCAEAGQECCAWEGDGACATNERCCPPDPNVEGRQRTGCIPRAAGCCPIVAKGFCEEGAACCPPDDGTEEARCCPSFGNGPGRCCDQPNNPFACPGAGVCLPMGCCGFPP